MVNSAAYRGWGIAFAVVGVLAFSFRPILIKLSYAAHPVSPVTLLFLRMSISLPFFLVVAWWLRGQEPELFHEFPSFNLRYRYSIENRRQALCHCIANAIENLLRFISRDGDDVVRLKKRVRRFSF